MVGTKSDHASRWHRHSGLWRRMAGRRHQPPPTRARIVNGHRRGGDWSGSTTTPTACGISTKRRGCSRSRNTDVPTENSSVAPREKEDRIDGQPSCKVVTKEPGKVEDRQIVRCSSGPGPALVYSRHSKCRKRNGQNVIAHPVQSPLLPPRATLIVRSLWFDRALKIRPAVRRRRSEMSAGLRWIVDCRRAVDGSSWQLTTEDSGSIRCGAS